MSREVVIHIANGHYTVKPERCADLVEKVAAFSASANADDARIVDHGTRYEVTISIPQE